MRNICFFLCLVLLSNADDLDMFDIVDNDINNTQTIQESHSDIRIKLSHLIQDKNKNETVFYANISDNKENYVYDIRIEANEDVQALHIKDLYYKTSYMEHYFFELGRMNVKEGIASGYNPTDYFKGGSSFTLSVDPKEKKENRLGTMLFQVSAIFDSMTIKALYSPKISSSQSIWNNKKYIGFHLDKSNSEERASFYVGYTGYDNMSIAGLLHSNADGLNIGLNLSYINGCMIWYMEGSIVEKKSNIDIVLNEFSSKEIQTTFSSDNKYRVELSLGINYTNDDNIVSTFEYIYNDAGFNNTDWKNYFSLFKKNLQYAGELTKARGEILNNATMLSKHTLFLMARQNDAITNLDWSVLSWFNPVDKSSLIQVGLSYEVDELLFSVDTRAYLGNSHTEYGSYPNAYEGLLSMTYFF